MAEPKVRFKKDDGSSYPAWSDVVLGDIATRVTRKNTNGETDRPLTIASIEGLVDQRTYFGKTIASKDMSGYFLLKNGEYAYNKSYSAGYDYGSIKRLDKYDMGALSTLYICFALNEDQNTDFYDCYFNGLSWYNQMPQICAEGARNHGLLNVSPNDFFKIRLSVPSDKEEQQKIADLLSSADEVISTSEQEVANLETQKKAVMKKIFSQEVRFKRNDGTVFPEWEEQTLGNLAEFSKGQGYTKSDLSETGSPIILYGRLYTKYQTVISAVDTFAEMKSRSVLSKKGDVIVPASGETAEDISVAAVVNVDGIILGGDLNIIHPCDLILPDYLAYALTFGTPHQEMAKRAQGKSIVHLHNDDLKSAVIVYPCLEEQRLIADFLSDFDEAIMTAKKELELWKGLKKGLLQQMFVRGEV